MTWKWNGSMLTKTSIDKILATLPQLSIAVLGDLFLDQYLELDDNLTESSLETGLPAYQVTRVRSQPGAAGTIINNLVALGVGRVTPISIMGDDGTGYELRKALFQMPAVDLTHVRISPRRCTPTYTKPMLHTRGVPARELNRLDIKNRTPTPPHLVVQILRSLELEWERNSAWIVLDQVSEDDCGVVTREVRQRLAELARGDPRLFVLADSRERIAEFQDVCLKPNESEAVDLARLRQRTSRPIFVTRGELGIHLYLPESTTPIEVPGYPVSGPVDPVGAGDSVSAGIACAIAAGSDWCQAAAFGNLVASITVQQIGTTGTATPEQVRQRWDEVSAGMTQTRYGD
jgi:bifunctional ADP-heptose synthase (sugar kinase/adenylyltransferase)